jgi:hypothetical protein
MVTERLNRPWGFSRVLSGKTRASPGRVVAPGHMIYNLLIILYFTIKADIGDRIS